jgi:hypothetical protein
LAGATEGRYLASNRPRTSSLSSTLPRQSGHKRSCSLFLSENWYLSPPSIAWRSERDTLARPRRDRCRIARRWMLGASFSPCERRKAAPQPRTAILPRMCRIAATILLNRPKLRAEGFGGVAKSFVSDECPPMHTAFISPLRVLWGVASSLLLLSLLSAQEMVATALTGPLTQPDRRGSRSRAAQLAGAPCGSTVSFGYTEASCSTPTFFSPGRYPRSSVLGHRHLERCTACLP